MMTYREQWCQRGADAALGVASDIAAKLATLIVAAGELPE
jgi:hypothetical protein